MRSKFKWIYALLIAFTMQFSFAQDKTVTGVVSDNLGKLPGVNVTVKGTNRRVATDFDGKYSIKVKEGETLVFTFVDKATTERKVGSAATMPNVSMKDATSGIITEVVVTTFNQKRNKKDLGYSVSTVKTADITENTEPDLLRSLNGKVAGVNVNVSTGAAGAANQILIRGQNTFTGDSDPLFIVDGVAFSNNSVETSSIIGGGGGYESAISSLDPNDIASVNVLKGAAASALYGSRAAGGVIVITTKSGSSKNNKKGKMGVNISLGTYFDKIANLPEYQNKYGAGGNNNYSNANGSWGPRFGTQNGFGIVNGTIPTWPTLLGAFPFLGPTQKYEARPDNVKDLFRTGVVLDRSIGFNYGGEDGGFNATISDLRQQSYIPNNEYVRTSFSAGGNFKINDRLTTGASVSFSKTTQIGPFFGEQQVGGASSSFARTLFLARNWDLNLPYIDPITGGSVTPNGTQFDHPLWSWANDKITTNTFRTNGQINLAFKINSHFNLSYIIGYNRYNLDRRELRDKVSRASITTNGSLRFDKFANTDIESTFIFNMGNFNITNDIAFDSRVGVNVLQNIQTRETLLGVDFKTRTESNLQNTKTISSLEDSFVQKRNVGFFAEATFSYKKFFFLTGTARNDVTSSLDRSKNSYFYPSLSTSFIVTDAFGIKSDKLSYAKIRASYARVGRDAEAEFRNKSFSGTSQNFNGLTTSTNNSFLPDPFIEPEFTTEYEIGTDLEMFNKRVVLDFSYYTRQSTNLISEVGTPAETGFTTLNTNGGSVENKGIEIGLTLVPIKTENFKWTMITNFTQNRNKVIEVGPGIERTEVRANSGLIAFNIPGEAFGSFYGTKFARDGKGNLLINPATGLIIQSPNLGIIGNPQADYKISMINNFSYKGFTLKSQVDFKKGGDIQSSTITTLLGRGVTRDTENRDVLNIIPGFFGDADGNPLLDVNGNQIPNTVLVTTNDLYFSPGGNAGGGFGINTADEGEVYDGTVVRLRELSLTYDVPAKFLKQTFIGAVSLSLMGSNLWYYAPNVPKYTNFDPDTASYGNGPVQGIETSAAPTSKRFGLKLNLTF